MKDVTTKYYCDRCGKEMKLYPFHIHRPLFPFKYESHYCEICNECKKEFDEWWRKETRTRNE